MRLRVGKLVAVILMQTFALVVLLTLYLYCGRQQKVPISPLSIPPDNNSSLLTENGCCNEPTNAVDQVHVQLISSTQASIPQKNEDMSEGTVSSDETGTSQSTTKSTGELLPDEYVAREEPEMVSSNTRILLNAPDTTSHAQRILVFSKSQKIDISGQPLTPLSSQVELRRQSSQQTNHKPRAESLLVKEQPSVTTDPTADRFSISPHFHFPQPKAVKPVSEILQSDWLKEFKSVLKMMNSSQVTMVTSNLVYKEVLLNWLISATVTAGISLEQILVLAMDNSLHKLLQERGVHSVLIEPSTFLSDATRHMGVFNWVMMTRLSIIRLLNHWHFDVANYDTDAILLRDLQPLFEQAHESKVIGTFGKFPQNLYREWGIALCTAVLVVRSSPQTELYWETLSRLYPGSFSDQERVNLGLKALHVRWELQPGALSDSKNVEGECSNGLGVTLLPFSVACRSNCRKSERRSYHVWHKGGHRDGGSKRKNAEAGGVWFLRDGWSTACRGETVGEQWLRCIANSFAFNI